MYTKLLLIGFASFYGCCAAIMAFNARYDPFDYYGMRAESYEGYSENQRYQNPALVRNDAIPADTIIIGTSRSENFQGSMFPNWDVLKLTMSGSSSYEQMRIMNLALRKREIDRILIELSYDSYAFGKDFRRQDVAFPEYLYGGAWTTPFDHLLSADLLSQAFNVAKGRSRFTELEMLNVWQPEHDEKFGKNLYLKDRTLRCQWMDDFTFVAAEGIGTSEIDATIEQNLTQLLRDNPDIEFKGYIPPFPALWVGATNYDTAAKRSYFEAEMYRLADKYENFSLYDFAIATDIVTQPENYKDFTHFHQDINRRMADVMQAEPEYRASDYAQAAARRRSAVEALDTSKLPCN